MIGLGARASKSLTSASASRHVSSGSAAMKLVDFALSSRPPGGSSWSFEISISASGSNSGAERLRCRMHAHPVEISPVSCNS